MDGESNMYGVEKRTDLVDCGLDLFGLKQIPGGNCEHNNDVQGSVEGGKFLDQVSDF